MRKFNPIAIIGQGCVLPGCFTPDELWNDLKDGKVNITAANANDWRIALDEVMIQSDSDDFLGRSSTDKGGYIREFDKVFDRESYRIKPELIDHLDPVFQWCFYAAGQALKDSGYSSTKILNRTGLILGNLSYPSTSFSRYYEENHMSRLFPSWKSSNKPVSPLNRFMSGLPAIKTAEALGLGGGALALDAACSSSLYAIKLACDELNNGKTDMMVSGGVNAADQLFLHIGFTALAALSPTGQSRPFNKGADGLIPAQGSAFVVLKRLEDAIRDGDSIAGVIRGIGLSNDGRSGGFLTPSKEGQIRCMNQAYEISGLKPEDISYIECHATGTSTGDSIEIDSMSTVFEGCKNLPIGSCKANFGHLITASGATGLLKVLQSIKNKEMLHTPGAYPLLGGMENSPFRVPEEPEKWNSNGPRRASVSNFGFGGTNAHLIVEEWTGKTSLSVSPKKGPEQSVAIVALAVKTDKIEDVSSFTDFIINGTINEKNLMENLDLTRDELNFPPADLKETLGQQLILLKVSAMALKQTGKLGKRTGVYIGMGADTEVSRYSLRWRLKDLLEEGKVQHNIEWLKETQKSIIPTLEAAAVVGTMPNIPANRLNTTYDFQGPSFTVSSEELSGDKAMEIARRAILSGEIDTALVGAVDFSSDITHREAYKMLAGEEKNSADAAVVLVLKSYDLAKKDGDRILAVLTENKNFADVQIDSSNSSSVTDQLGHSHACSGILNIAKAVVLASRNFIIDKKDGHYAGPSLSSKPVYYQVRTKSFFGPSFTTWLNSDPDSFEMNKSIPNLDRLFTYGADSVVSLTKMLEEDIQSREGLVRLAFVANKISKTAILLHAITLLEKGLIQEGLNGQEIFYYSKKMDGKIAFIYTGSASSYPGMGRELIGEFPQIIDWLKPKLEHPEEYSKCFYVKEDPGAKQPFYQLAGSSFLCQVHTEFTHRILKIKPEAAMGLSSGETNSMFALGVWTDMDGLLKDISNSGMYDICLGEDFASVRKHWGEAPDFKVDWDNVRLLAPVSKVKALLKNEERVYLTIINTPDDCVIGGDSTACKRITEELEDCIPIPLGHDIAIHCPAILPYEKTWRSLHTRKSTIIPEITFYSNYFGGIYETTESKVADALTGQAIQTIDFPKIIDRAWDDGVRIFIEHGPRNSLSRAIDTILENKPHLAVSLDQVGKSSYRQVLTAAGGLWSAGVPVDIDAIDPISKEDISKGPFFTFKLRKSPIVLPVQEKQTYSHFKLPKAEIMAPAPKLASMEYTINLKPDDISKTELNTLNAIDSPLSLILNQHRNLMEVHKQYMDVQLNAHNRYLSFLDRAAAGFPQIKSQPEPDFVQKLIKKVSPPVSIVEKPVPKISEISKSFPGPSFNRKQLGTLSAGSISSVFGDFFEPLDKYAILVRMPEPPLLLCDRVLGIKGEPGSLGTGTIWTETDVKKDSWYLHNGRMPAGIFIESGQADLLLVSWLGVDFHNKGERAYRLLGCELTYYGHLPKPGETLEYDIHIDGYANQGDVMLFFFHYDCHIDGKLRISVRSGQAGFFTKEELDDTGGVIWEAKDGTYASNPRLEFDSNHTQKTRFSSDEVKAYTEGDMVACFGSPLKMTKTHTRSPRSQSGYQNFIQEVKTFDPYGGPKGRGHLCSVSKVTPDDWYFKGHFKNDPCMPGTLMAEACLQMMAFYMVGLGMTTDKDGWRFEPLPENKYTFVCRGQCTPSSKEMVYDIYIDEVIKGPYPTLIAHVMCTVDGNKAFLCEQLALRLVPDWPGTDMTGLFDKIETGLPAASIDGFVFDLESLKNCAIGRPSLAFGETFQHYDDIIRSPRLPGPPYLFVTRISELDARMGVSTGQPTLVAKYDIPDDAWYFDENRFGTMPYCVLMEIALQPCGWLSTFTMRDNTAGKDLVFRNLDGNAIQYKDILPAKGQTIATSVKLTSASIMENVIIVKFDVECSIDDVSVFSMDTVFGFFSTEAMVDQKGLTITDDELRVHKLPPNINIELKEFPSRYFSQSTARLPDSKLLMLDRITAYWPEGGSAGLGHMCAEKDVRVEEWFFKSHFFQDPVQPGSLGIEAIIQLMQFYMLHTEMHREMKNPRFEPIILNEKTTWIYRGQVTPDKTLVRVDIDILEQGKDELGVYIIVSSNYWVDGLKIYSAPRIGMRLIDQKIDTSIFQVPQILEYYSGYKNISKDKDGEIIADFVEDWEKAQINRFIRNIIIEDFEEYSKIKRGSVIYLANHQNFIEPCLLSLMVKWAGGSPMKIIGKIEHRDTWVGKLDTLGKKLFGKNAGVELLTFDREKPEQILKLLKDFEDNIISNPCSLLIHVEGKRAQEAGHQIKKISSVLFDIAKKNSLPIIPLRFVGGLPNENIKGRVDFTYGYGPQDYYLGKAISPEELEGINLKERSQLVLERINSLGADVEGNGLIANDSGFANKVKYRMQKNLSESSAVFIEALLEWKDRSDNTNFMLSKITEGKKSIEKTKPDSPIRALLEYFMM